MGGTQVTTVRNGEFMKIAALLLATLVLSSGVLNAGERVDVRVSPSVAFAPADLRVRASVAANADNRAVVVIAESATFYSSSEIQLDGEHAPQTTEVMFRSLPVGQYSVRVVVKGAHGKEIAVTKSAVSIVDQNESW